MGKPGGTATKGKKKAGGGGCSRKSSWEAREDGEKLKWKAARC